MTDSVDRLATPTDSSDWLDLVARTDGPTDSRSGYSPSDESSLNASPAGGHEDSADDEGYGCSHTPHVYVVYWPDLAVLKVGISKQARWEWWTRRGAVLVAAGDVCCMEFARKIESHLLGIARRYGAQAFRNEQEAQLALGRNKGGFSECVRLVQSPRRGEFPTQPDDLERAYGLILPAQFTEALKGFNLPLRQITRAWLEENF